ncbi:MAG TPA: hypothetical protein VN455_04470 [Methanotrichaceae archaeon]|nr:hypothetical protein [Methanotrichaceae archaeon]
MFPGYSTDPAKAMSGLQNLSLRGTKVVIAGITSAEPAAIKDYRVPSDHREKDDYKHVAGFIT